MKFSFEVVERSTGISLDLDKPDNIFRLKPDGSLVTVDWKGRESGALSNEYEVVIHFEAQAQHIAINLANGIIKTNPI